MSTVCSIYSFLMLLGAVDMKYSRSLLDFAFSSRGVIPQVLESWETGRTFDFRRRFAFVFK